MTRVFHIDRDLYVYLQAYAGAGPGPSPEKSSTPTTPILPLLAFLTFYQDGRKVLQMQAVQAAMLTATRLGTIPVSMQIPLAKLSPGQYQCQVTVIDPAGNRATFWQEPIMLVH